MQQTIQEKINLLGLSTTHQQRQHQEGKNKRSLGFKGCLSLQKVSTTWDDAAASATSIIMSRKVRGI
jgi:hypothetical protein